MFSGGVGDEVGRVIICGFGSGAGVDRYDLDGVGIVDGEEVELEVGDEVDLMSV